MQINMTGFLNGKNARQFMDELWALLLSAQESENGIPEELIAQKKEEILKREEDAKLLHDAGNNFRNGSEDIDRSQSRDNRNRDHGRKSTNRSVTPHKSNTNDARDKSIEQGRKSRSPDQKGKGNDRKKTSRERSRSRDRNLSRSRDRKRSRSPRNRGRSSDRAAAQKKSPDRSKRRRSSRSNSRRRSRNRSPNRNRRASRSQSKSPKNSRAANSTDINSTKPTKSEHVEKSRRASSERNDKNSDGPGLSKIQAKLLNMAGDKPKARSTSRDTRSDKSASRSRSK